MDVDFWRQVSAYWSRKIDSREYENEKKVAFIVGAYVSDIPEELYEDSYDDDDDEDW